MTLRPSTPPLAALDLFCSVVELGSLSKAAEAHHIAQPSASGRVRALERQLKMTLLERSPSGSRPTPEGELVAQWAANVLQSATEFNAGVDALRARKAGRLRVAASLTIAEYLLPAWLEAFLRNRKDDSVKLAVANSSSVTHRLRQRQAELGFIESPDTAEDLAEQTVGRDRLVVVVSPSHPWAKAGEVSLDAFVATPLVLREQGSGTRDALDAELATLGFAPAASAMELGSTAAVRSAVINGRSPAVISDRAVAADLVAGSLVEIVVPGLAVDRSLRAVWIAGQPLSELARDFLADLPDLSSPIR